MISYKKFLDEVTEQEITTRKKAAHMVVRLLVFMLAIAIGLAIAASAVTGTLLGIIALLVSVWGYLALLEYATNDDQCYKRVNFVSKLWLAGIIALVGTLILLHTVVGVV